MKRIVAALAIFLGLAGEALAQSSLPPPAERYVEGSLHAARTAIAPGETITIVLRQNITEGWHTYWRNPGDSGEPTDLTWTAPAGYEIGPIQWPTPHAIPFATLVNFGYEGDVLFPIEVTAPASARPGDEVTLTAEAYWLVCSDICIPEEATLTLTLPVAANSADDPQWAPRVAQAVAEIPRRQAGVEARITGGEPARLSVSLPNADDIRNVRFFPYSRDVLLASGSQSPQSGRSGVSFVIDGGVADDVGRVAMEGVVAYETRDGRVRGIEIVAEPGDPLPGTDGAPAPTTDDYPLAELDGGASATAQAPPMDALGISVAIGLAFLGGLILNIMPCVLPVLSVKALSFAGGAHGGQRRRDGLLYFAGVLATFLALA
ncbi:MAG: hypothetical protein K2X34_02315, partial [Hyphomonadaceae bacterium]|nr:hypothetical protein [Hyphomonadaceae bacterium]